MIKTLLAQVKEFKKASFLTPVFMILEVVVETMIPLVMADMIDNGVEAGNISYLYRKGAIMALLAVAGLVTGILGGKYGAYASSGFARNLRKAMYTNIQTFSFSNIDKFSTASLITRLTTDVTNLQNAYQMILRMCTRAPASLICAMVMAFLINAKLASIYLIAVIFLGACLIFIMRKATKYFQTVFRKYDDLNASVQENIGAVRVVKAYVREDYEISKFQKACNKVYEMFLSAEKIVVMNMPLMQFTVYACILGISWLGAKMIVGSTLTTGELMSLLTYCMNILMSLMMLSMVFVMVTMSIASAERVTEVINDTADITDPENPVTKVPDGSIVFDHVNFSYKKDSKEPVLKDINLSIRSGETIGIIGGTGSGKSTTLAAIIDKINNNRDAHVITLEDPIEYLHQHKMSMVNQREIGIDSNNYANALRAALREDPDVILVGEMRDFETISVAITAAETGHLVLSTLHTIGAASTVDRVIDVFPPHQQQQIRVQLSNTLEAVVSQQLIPTADGKHRVAAFEVMHANHAVRNLIREGKSHQLASVMQTNRKLGMITMDEAIVQLYFEGKIDREHAIQFAQDPDSMENKI